MEETEVRTYRELKNTISGRILTNLGIEKNEVTEVYNLKQNF